MTEEFIVLATVGALVVVVLGGLMFAIARGGFSAPAVADGDAMGELKTMLANREGAMAEKVAQLDTKLAGLQESVTTREVALNTQVAGIGAEMKTIAGLFTNDRTRGNWGEISMTQIFEIGGMVEGRDYETQFTFDGRRPDAVVHIPGGCEVVIDSKFPQARYLESLDVEDSDERMRLLELQGKELESVGKELKKKHYSELASGSYVIMYLPSQAVYEAAISAHPAVLGSLMEIGVIVAGPNSLFAVLMNVASLMKEHRAIQQADEILAQAKDLQGRMTTFIGHLEKVGRALRSTVSAYNGAVGSWVSTVSPQLDRIGDLRGESISADIIPIDEALREIPAERQLQAAND
jgi:DNA recombination protein RmuC